MLDWIESLVHRIFRHLQLSGPAYPIHPHQTIYPVKYPKIPSFKLVLSSRPLFFQASRSINAGPISMRIDTLGGGHRGPLEIRTLTSYERRCCTVSNCPPPPRDIRLKAQSSLDTGWHFGGTSLRNYEGDRNAPHGGPCSPGFQRSHVVASRLGGNGACEYAWASSDPSDCRIWRRYSRPGSSYLQCGFEVYEFQNLEHPEPLCRPSGC